MVKILSEPLTRLDRSTGSVALASTDPYWSVSAADEPCGDPEGSYRSA